MADTEKEKALKVTIGCYLRFWHDTVAFGVEPVYARILKVSPKTVLVRTEAGDVKRIPLERATSHLIGNNGEWHPEIADR